MRNGKREDLPWALAHAQLADLSSVLTDVDKSLIEGAIRARDVRRLSELPELLWPAYQSADVCLGLRQLSALFRKNSQFANSDSCREAAWQSFLRGERLCRITNRRLAYFQLFPERLDASLASVIRLMMKVIERTLGSHVAYLDAIPDLVRLTAGASENLPRTRAQPFMKLKGKVRLPSRSAPFVSALCQRAGIDAPPIRVVDRNRITMVPKSWKTDRTIACEPTGLLPFQLAFDSYVKRRLRTKLGIDLASQERNSNLARKGSVDGSFATIDLSMASDTLSMECVRWLVPPEWWDLLQRLRVRTWSFEGQTGNYAKFSSMGNGCTFGLETLIFTAACVACGSKGYAVYGDDIVVEAELAPMVLRVLKLLGFIPNRDKTYLSGPFRESCGGDYYGGVDVTPHYLREEVKRQSDVALLVNGLVPKAVPGGHVWHVLRRLVHDSKVLIGAFTTDPCSNVWVDVTTAYERKLLSNKSEKYRGIVTQKQYVGEDRKYRAVGSRSLLWWHLSVRARLPYLNGLSVECWFARAVRNAGLRTSDRGSAPAESHVVSGIPYGRVRYRERRAVWFFPDGPTPAHLYWWADFLYANA